VRVKVTPAMNGRAAFDRQVQTLIDKGYAQAASMTRAEFVRQIGKLKSGLPAIRNSAPDLRAGRLPFVIVVKSGRIAPEWMLSRVEREGRRGLTSMHPVTPDAFTAIDGVTVPDGLAYLLLNIDRGSDTLNVRPEDALAIIRRRKRTPLTIDEGIAIVTHHPDFLQKNNCFSLLASRRTDQRVPAIWLDGRKRPKLGWCWDRNPHSWLGSASARRRTA
jgi:hypothetical protein